MATRDPFDFFFGEILRLAPGQRDPDHYTLLGLAFFEKSEERIKRAGHERKRALRAVPAGPPEFEHVRKQLIERVRDARRTLLDPQRREGYDGFLIGHGDEPEEPDFALEEGVEFAGRFRILKELRKGAFGRVYAVLDSREAKRLELTILPPESSHDLGRRRRAERAARRLARVDLPGVLGVIAVGEAEGLFHARWPAPEGVSLLRHVRRNPHGRLDPPEAARITAGIARALARLHGEGLVHGDLHARNIFVTEKGDVSIAECGLAAAAIGALPTSAYSAPERELTAAADLYALGAIAYFLLQGEAPFLDGGRALVPKPLPDEVPVALARTVLGLIAREPDQRPTTPEFARARPSPRRWIPVAAGLALLAAVGIVGMLLSGPADDGSPSLVARAWELIEERKFGEAIRLIEEAGTDPSLHAPLASALEGEAHRLEKAGEPYAAQTLLAQAQKADPDQGRAAQFERVRRALLERLDAVEVNAPEIARTAELRVDPKRAALARIWIDGRPVQADQAIRLEREEGLHRIAFRLEDLAGNRRDGVVVTAIDRTAPELGVVSPADQSMQREGSVVAEATVSDAHAPPSMTIHGRTAPIREGKARLRLTLPNGKHVIVFRVIDRAGNERQSSVAITIDDRAPKIVLDTARVVTRKDEATLRGRVEGAGSKLVVDGRPVPLDEQGRFAIAVGVESSRAVELIATGPTGVVQTVSVDCVRDASKPKLTVLWARRDVRGRMLYGGKEMDAGAVRLDLRAGDDTKMRFEPSEGEVRDNVWILAPHEGEREATLAAIDEAGNRTTVEVRLAGHRATPGLSVHTQLEDVSRASRAALNIEADQKVFLNGKLVEPGRVEVTLPEGEVELVVRAVDPWGNETSWKKTVRVDRTPPRVRVIGPPTRGVGRQPLTLEADEELASITCLSMVKDDPGQRVTFDADLEAGRTQIHVVARDLAGNVAKLKLALQVINRVLLLDGKSALRVALEPKLDEFTVEFWARGTPAIDPAVMVSRGVGRAWQLIWASADEALPHALVQFVGEGPATLVAKKLRDPIDWHHYALVHDGKKLRFFLDGKQQEFLEARIGLASGGSELIIGGAGLDEGGRVQEGFAGRLDELRLSEGARYLRAFRPKRFFRADKKTRLLMRFDLVVDGAHPDSSAAAHKVKTVGEPKLAIVQD
ncbi:MAG: protein kinase domain-containing protein [Planctomycetota bacterium]